MARRTTGSIIAVAAWVALACSAPAEPTHATTTRSPEPAENTGDPPDPGGSAAGDEVDAPPAPDAATLADGRLLVVPGPDGFLGTWRVWASGRVEDEAALGVEEEDAEPRIVASDDWRIELGEVAARARDRVYLGATLLVPQRTRAWLMIGMRGAASVLLDGAELGQRESPDRYRADYLLARLDLSEGEHRLVLRFDAPERGRWRGAIRWLDAHTRAGAGNVAIALGRPDEETIEARLAEAVRFDERHELGESGPEVRVRAHLPGGGPARPVTVHIGDDEATLSPEGRVHAGRHELRVPMPARGGLTLSARVGERSVRLAQRVASDRAALEAAASLRGSLARAPESARAPIDWRMNELLRAVREHDPDPVWRTVLAREARRIATAVARERDPFERIRGYERMAFFSRLDGTAQEYELFVPPTYRPGREWPLLVTLHGYKGNAGDYFRNTFGLARNHEGGETLLAHGRHGVAPRSGPMIVIGPTGRGQSYYRHAGEVDVLEAMADVQRRFSIDPDRVYVTGGSMGGTGAAYLPFRCPDLFAASAALAGYHDQRVRSDTDHASLSPAEQFLEAHRSDVDWADNALHLPMLLVRGTRDRPLAWTRSLVTRMAELGYRAEHREPELGHNVWTETYAEGAIFRYLGRYRRPSHPAHVVLRTARERTREAWWVRVEQREAPDRFAHVDATLADGVVSATIEGARAVTFSPAPPLVEEGAPLTVRVGDSEVTGAAPLTLERAEEGWRAATREWPERDARQGAVDGPIRDVFHEPLTFVIGTQDPDHTLINRMVARRWAHPKGWIVDYPIVDDVDVTDAMIRERTLVLVGPPSSNAVHARMAEGLPIRVTRDAVRLGDEAHRGEQVGTVFVARSPLAHDRTVLVIAGPRPLGTWRSLDLPDILPDYVVFDERVAAARDQWACGGTGAEYRAHGFLDMYMRLP